MDGGLLYAGMGAVAYLRQKVGRGVVALGRIHSSGTNTGTNTDTSTGKYRHKSQTNRGTREVALSGIHRSGAS